MRLPTIKKWLWYLLVLVIISISLISIFLSVPYGNKDKTSVEPIQFVGTYQLEDGSLPSPLTNNTYINACENESVIFSGNFNKSIKKDTQLLFFAEYLEIQIFLKGELLFTWGTADTYPSFMRSGGAAWGHCTVPVTISTEDEVVMVLKSKYDNNYNYAYHDFFDSLKTGDSGALARLILTKNWPYLLTGLLLFLVGLTLQLFIVSLLRQGIKIHSSVYYSALFIFVASLWVVLNPVYSTLLFDNATLIMLLETISMWLFSTFLFGYFGTFMQTNAKKANDILMFGFACGLLLFLVLQLFGITDAYAVREHHNMLLIVASAASLVVFLYEVYHAKKSKICTLALPGLLYAIFGIIEVLNYEFEWVRYGTALTIGFAIFIMVQFIFSVRQIRESLLMKVKVAELERDLVQSRTAVMLSQIQPHFLYNALTGIKALCGSDPGRAEDAMEHFSYFLRGNLDSLSDIHLITFDKEISHVKDYFYLEEMRFKERVKLDLKLEFRDFMLPPLTLQPLVENAVRYGITKKDTGGIVTISSGKQGGQVFILITDNGVGFDISTQPESGRSHTGIENVRSRLQQQCGGTLEIKSERGVGTQVRITLQTKEGLR